MSWKTTWKLGCPAVLGLGIMGCEPALGNTNTGTPLAYIEVK
ncbi:hypothetical protein [Myxococcus xanthus]|nr:hypothetical protein [Myxococcus xanthus]